MYTNVPQTVSGSIATVAGVATLLILPVLVVTNPDTGMHINSVYRIVGLKFGITGPAGSPAGPGAVLADISIFDSGNLKAFFLHLGMGANNRNYDPVIPEPGIQIFPPGYVVDSGVNFVVNATAVGALAEVVLQYFIDDVSPD